MHRAGVFVGPLVTWWFWTLTGAVVADGTATAVMLTLPEDQDPGDLGAGRLQ